MSMNHAVVWLDQSVAHILHFNTEASESHLLKSHSKHPRLHANSDKRHSADDRLYLDRIASLLADTQEILITGPAQEKQVFSKHLAEHHPEIAAKIVGIETTDHPSEKQLLAFAKKYFVKADLFR